MTSGDRYKQILETAPDAMVIVERDETIAFVNRQTEKMFGYSRDELIGKPLDVVIPTRFRGTHKGHVERYFAKPGTRPMGSGIGLFGRRADGIEIAIEVSLSPVQTDEGMFVSAAIRDITERRRIEATAKLNADRLESAVETIQDAFALFDSEERLVLSNSVYRRVVGESASGPILGRSYDDLFESWEKEMVLADDERESFRAERRKDKATSKSGFDVRVRDGRSFRVTTHRTLEGGIVQTIWDLTDDVKLAEELREARTAAEAGSAAKSEFLSSMSHELRTPLNAILGFAQLLHRDKKEPLSDRHRERAAQILKGGEHLLRLIDDILDLSRIEAGGVVLSPETVKLSDVLETIRTTLEPIATRDGVTITLDELPANVDAVTVDRTRFAQILMNLGSNAIKYNRPRGKVTFSVAKTDSYTARITVTDTGIGIAADKQLKLFQPFQRAGQETGPIQGTGIGLVITKRLAELMNGRVGFHSEPDVGSKFWVEVPTPTMATPESAQTLQPSEFGARLGHDHHLVLYVEDNPANVAFMTDALSSYATIELISAPTAEMGIELARARPPAVIIMDINLPGISGLDALHVLREFPETRDIPVIALTAAASERDRQRGEQAGFFRYLTKPVKLDELEQALATLLGS